MNDVFFKDVPNQLKKSAEKNSNDFQHYKDTLDAYVSMSKFANIDGEKYDLNIWYRVYNGEKIEEHYSAFEDPFGTKTTTNPLPLNDVKPFNIIRANIDIIINEKSKRPWNYQAVVKNPDVISRRTEEMEAAIKESLTKQFVNLMNKNGMNTGVPMQDTPMPDEIQLQFETSYADKRALRAQKILRVSLSEENVRDKLNRLGMKHWCIAGEVNTYKGIRQNDFVYEIINPLWIDFIGSKDYRYGRDKEACVYRVLLPFSKVIDSFRDLLSKEQIERLSNGPSMNQEPIDYSKFGMIISSVDPYDRQGEMIEVIHCTYKSFKYIGIITYIDEFDEEQMIEVDDTFDKKLFMYQIIDEKWEWRSCVDEVYRIDGDIYIGMGEIPWLTHKKNNPSLISLPYNQIRYSDLNTTNTSLVREAYIYQYFWNIYKAKMERLISVDKGEVSIIDRAVLADHGLNQYDIDKAMYYIETQHILWIDSRRDDMGKFANWGSKLNFSQSNAVASLIQVLNVLRQELDMAMGITPQRRGEIANSAGKAATEYALERSYNVSEGIFVDFENFEEEELNDIIDIAKKVYSGIAGMYIIEGMPTFLDPEEEDISEEDLGVYMSKTSADKVKLDAMRALAQPFAQNVGKQGITPEIIASIIESENMAEIKMSMKKAEMALKSYETQQQMAQRQMEQDKIDSAERLAIEQREWDANENALDRQKDIIVAQIKSAGLEQETTIGNIDTSVIDTAADKARQAMDKTKQANDKLTFEKQKHEDEMKDNEKERENKIKLEKMKLKNKVVGEK